MINFKEWLISEGLFEIPFKSLEKIHQYFLDGYRKYIDKPRTKFPPINFKLDLRGTKYEFLQYLNPSVDILLKPSVPNASGIYNGMKEENKGSISLSLTNSIATVQAILEHEVLHYLQDLIAYHAKQQNKKLKWPKGDLTKRQREKSTKRRMPLLGGLPRTSLVKRLMKEKGFDIEGHQKDRRTKHEHRPVEYYTNLNSLIKTVKHGYLILIFEILDIKNNDDYKAKKDQIESFMNDKKQKTKFLNKLIESKSYSISDLEKIKKLDEELYKIYMKEIFKNFIDNNNFSEELEIKKIADEIKILNTSKQQADIEKKRKKTEKLSERIIGNFSEADFKCTKPLTIEMLDVMDFSNLEDDNTGAAEDMFSQIGKHYNKNDEISITITYSNLDVLFRKIKSIRYKSSDTLSKIEKCQWDYFAIELINQIQKHITIYGSQISSKQPKREDLIKMFYPGPYENCDKDENGNFLEENYQGSHRPPSEDYGAPLHNLTKIYPDDVYANVKNYTTGSLELESGLLATKYKNRPEKYIIIYRAVPKGVKEINPGDWVTINMEYAQQHSKHHNDPNQDLDIIMGRAKAEDLFTDGNSLAEWGYQGKDKINCQLI